MKTDSLKSPFVDTGFPAMNHQDFEAEEEVRFCPRRFTVAEYHEMGRVGILKPEERVELIKGEIVTKSPIGTPHIWCVNRLNLMFARAIGLGYMVSVQNSILFGNHSEPEPDVVIV
jgi:Uma2 family endonuclease